MTVDVYKRQVKSLSNCNMGVSMILIGAIIGSSRMGKLWDKDCFLYCLIRLGLCLLYTSRCV